MPSIDGPRLPWRRMPCLRIACVDAGDPGNSAAQDLEVVESHLSTMEARALLGTNPRMYIIVETHHYIGFFADDPRNLQILLTCWGIDRVDLYAIWPAAQIEEHAVLLIRWHVSCAAVICWYKQLCHLQPNAYHACQGGILGVDQRQGSRSVTL